MILLTGATGQVGLRVARRLANHAGVRALARTDPSAATLRDLGVEVVRGDLADPASLGPALAGVESLFLLTPFSPDQARLEHNALDAGRELRRVVKVSAINRGIAISKAHEAVAGRLRKDGPEATILHADFFVSNLLTQLDPIRNGQLIYPADGARRAFVDPEDIAAVAAAELTGETPVGGELTITGPESLTFADLAERISKGLGRRVALVDPPADVWRDGLVAAGVPRLLRGRPRRALRARHQAGRCDRPLAGRPARARTACAERRPLHPRRARTGAMTSILLTPYRFGRLELPNWIVMAPMTRNRAGPGNAPTQLNASYYAQRASLGLVIAEGTQPLAMGQGYPGTPGIHTDEQEAGWRLVADAVHAAGGRIFVQLMHAGRISHPSLLPGVALPVAPSAVRPAGHASIGEPFVTPRPLELDELPGVIDAFVQAAGRAVRAGLDGVELHAANGYLLHQFLGTGTNRRTDAYGGSVAARIRVVVETAEEVATAIGADRVGIRLSPANPFNDMAEDDPEATYPALLQALAPLALAYVHVVESPPESGLSAIDLAREHWRGTLIANSGAPVPWTPDGAAAVLEAGRADLVSFARHALANPDLPERIRRGAALNEPEPDTLYGGDHHGYTDYPTLDETLERVA